MNVYFNTLTYAGVFMVVAGFLMAAAGCVVVMGNSTPSIPTDFEITVSHPVYDSGAMALLVPIGAIVMMFGAAIMMYSVRGIEEDRG